MMRNKIKLVGVMMIFSAPALANPCGPGANLGTFCLVEPAPKHINVSRKACLSDGQRAMISGTVVQITTHVGDTESSRNGTARLINLDRPVCFSDYPVKQTRIEGGSKVTARWVGHRVTISGHVGMNEGLAFLIDQVMDAK